MSSYIEPPASDKILDTLVTKVIKKNLVGQSVSVVAFKGSGKMSELKYLARHNSEIPAFDNKIVYLLFDCLIFADQPVLAIQESVTFLENMFSDVVGALPKREKMNQKNLLNLLNTLVTEKNLYVAIIVDNFSHAYFESSEAKVIIDTLLSFKRVNPMKISFVFIADVEFDEKNIRNMERLSSVFLENVVLGKDVAFDADSCDCMFVNQSKRSGFVFPTAFKKNVTEICRHDPVLSRQFALKAIDNPSFCDFIEGSPSAEAVYKEVGDLIMKARFERIINSLLPKSLECLLNNFKDPTDFLRDTGLVSVEGLPVNKMFELYIKFNGDYIKSVLESKGVEGSVGGGAGAGVSNIVIANLTAQEVLVYKLLVANMDRVVAKEDVAKALWGDTWEEKYSDWAIDRLISNLKAKLVEFDASVSLKTLRGRGYSLV